MVWLKLTKKECFVGVSTLILFEGRPYFYRGFFLRGGLISKGGKGILLFRKTDQTEFNFISALLCRRI